MPEQKLFLLQFKVMGSYVNPIPRALCFFVLQKFSTLFHPDKTSERVQKTKRTFLLLRPLREGGKLVMENKF